MISKAFSASVLSSYSEQEVKVHFPTFLFFLQFCSVLYIFRYGQFCDIELQC